MSQSPLRELAAGRVQDAELALALVEINRYRIHGGRPPELHPNYLIGHSTTGRYVDAEQRDR